eukprot:TRINITY_DN105753_c0_g1_i1.p1 TRINITY_DN105753_c0_g1~~TRINITY_DN105753_c0_g1_i1.p1  ORF type:complete len:276 (+),score=31.72 TRINITY_DN105753_c0_g1_i1:109-828(+)
MVMEVQQQPPEQTPVETVHLPTPTRDTKPSSSSTPTWVNKKRKTDFGYFTKHGMYQFSKQFPDDPGSESLNADPDPSKPLYFWQLYSVMGRTLIEQIVTDFYTRIFDSTDPEHTEFRYAFERIGPVERHITTQVQLWLDAFGAGKAYHGGDFRVNFHHKNNAPHVMNQQGGVLWVQYMNQTLNDCAEILNNVDPRLRRTLEVFVYVMVEKYAAEFKFKTGESVYGRALMERVGVPLKNK